MCSPQGASDLGQVAQVLADSESFQAHSLSAAYRVRD
jgi:histidinol dehydrogenase